MVFESSIATEVIVPPCGNGFCHTQPEPSAISADCSLIVRMNKIVRCFIVLTTAIVEAMNKRKAETPLTQAKRGLKQVDLHD